MAPKDAEMEGGWNCKGGLPYICEFSNAQNDAEGEHRLVRPAVNTGTVSLFKPLKLPDFNLTSLIKEQELNGRSSGSFKCPCPQVSLGLCSLPADICGALFFFFFFFIARGRLNQETSRRADTHAGVCLSVSRPVALFFF